MALTGLLGTAESRLGNILLGGVPSPELPAPSELLYFMPPNEETERVPPWVRIPGVPRSNRYRQFMRYQQGVDVQISGIRYGGGRWHGPLSDAEVTAIVDAGLEDRIVRVTEFGDLPANLD
jgi:hypothetical protein